MNNEAKSSNGKELTPLEQAAGFYIKSPYVHKGPHLFVVVTCLEWLIGLNRRAPIGSVGPGMVFRALASRDRPDYSYDRVLKEIREFFDWCQKKGYRPKNQPNPVDVVRVARLLLPEPVSADTVQKLCALAPDVISKMKVMLSVPKLHLSPIHRHYCLEQLLGAELASQKPMSN